MRRCIVKHPRTDAVYKRYPNFVVTVPADGRGARLSTVGVLGEESVMFMSKFIWLPTISYIHECDSVIQIVDETSRDTGC